MPPMISSDESGSEDLDTIPSKPVKKQKRAKPASPEPESEEDDAASDGAGKAGEISDDEDAETFAVEKILTHEFGAKGVVLYRVKWLGYEDESDLTWEPAENLTDGAGDILQEYHKMIGGVPSKPKPGRGKRKASTAAASPAPASTPKHGRGAKKAKTNGEGWQMPVGSWEDEVQAIQTITDEVIGDNGKGNELQVFMLFNDGHRTKIGMSLVRQKCPQKLLDYYEQHLSFKDPKPAESAELALDDETMDS